VGDTLTPRLLHLLPWLYGSAHAALDPMERLTASACIAEIEADDVFGPIL